MHALKWLFALALLCGVGRPDALAQLTPEVQRNQLEAEFERAYEARDWSAAIKAGEQVVALVPAEARPAYNLACAHALAGQTEAAIAWLGRAAERGFASVEVFDNDADLDGLRGDARLSTVREVVVRNHGRILSEAKAAVEDRPIVFHVPAAAWDRDPATRPLLIALHGYGSSASEMLPAFRAFADATGVVLALPEGAVPHRDGFDWVSPDHAEAVVMHTLDVARARYPYDPRQVVLAGFSQGASMAMRVALRHPDVFRGVVAMAGRHDARVVPGRTFDPKARRLRVMLTVGAGDQVVANNREAERRLKAARFDVGLRVYPNVGHRLPPNAVAEFREALRFVLR
jgi:phospholipase/carboxylesterase